MKPLDETDHAIIEMLKTDGRMANREIARRLDVSETMVRTRLKRLERDKVLRVGVVMNPQAEGLSGVAYLGIGTKPGKTRSVAEALTEKSNVGYVAMTLGPFDIFCLLLAEDLMSLQSRVSEEIDAIEGVTHVEILPLTNGYKHAAQWANISGSHPQK